MKNQKQTPGPWTAVYKPSMNLAGIHIRSSDKYLEVNYCNSSETEMPEANARLIAAAPEMLQALEVAVKYFNDNGGHEAYTFLADMENALSKARGES